MTVRDGRFGAYVNWGKVNATLPKSMKPDSISLGEALELIAEREGRPAPTARKPPAKAAAKPAASGKAAPAKMAATKAAPGKARTPAVKRPPSKKPASKATPKAAAKKT